MFFLEIIPWSSLSNGDSSSSFTAPTSTITNPSATFTSSSLPHPSEDPIQIPVGEFYDAPGDDHNNGLILPYPEMDTTERNHGDDAQIEVMPTTFSNSTEQDLYKKEIKREMPP